MNKAIGLYGFITLTQPQEFDNENFGEAPGIRKTEVGAPYTPNRMKTDSRIKQKQSLRI